MLEVVERCWKVLEVVGSCWKLLEVVGGCWKLLDVVGSCWELLEVVGDFWIVGRFLNGWRVVEIIEWEEIVVRSLLRLLLELLFALFVVGVVYYVVRVGN